MNIKVIASGSSGNCYLISDDKTSLLLDAGISFKQIQIGTNFNISNIGGCFVTHRHIDHAKSIKDLNKRGVPIFGPKDVAEIYPIKIIKPFIRLKIGTFEIVPFPLKHDVECYGYQIMNKDNKLVYITDTVYAKYKFSNLTHIMIEANYDRNIIRNNTFNDVVNGKLANRIIASHMSLDTVKEFLSENDLNKVQQIYLLHLSDNNSDTALFKDAIQRQTGAEVYVF